VGLYRSDIGGGYCIRQQDDIKNGPEKLGLLYESTAWRLFGSTSNLEYSYDYNAKPQNVASQLAFPHNDRMNILFADSHVSAKSLGDLQAPGAYYFLHKCP
jgi:prepilin-type processing-associated H-X9-DG protein